MIYINQQLFKYIHVFTNMARMIEAVSKGKIKLTDEVEEIYEKRVSSYGNGAKIDSQKKYIGKRAYVVILKD